MLMIVFGEEVGLDRQNAIEIESPLVGRDHRFATTRRWREMDSNFRSRVTRPGLKTALCHLRLISRQREIVGANGQSAFQRSGC
jgi:hypothetical protein